MVVARKQHRLGEENSTEKSAKHKVGDQIGEESTLLESPGSKAVPSPSDPKRQR
jgi:hypothetical protein